MWVLSLSLFVVPAREAKPTGAHIAAMAAVLSSSFTTVRCSATATAAPRTARSGVAVGAPVQFAAAKGLRASSSVALAGKRVESPLTVTRAAPSPSTVSPVARGGGGRRGGRNEPDDGFEERLVQVRPSPKSPIQPPRFRTSAHLADLPAFVPEPASAASRNPTDGTSADSRQLADSRVMRFFNGDASHGAYPRHTTRKDNLRGQFGSELMGFG